MVHHRVVQVTSRSTPLLLAGLLVLGACAQDDPYTMDQAPPPVPGTSGVEVAAGPGTGGPDTMGSTVPEPSDTVGALPGATPGSSFSDPPSPAPPSPGGSPPPAVRPPSSPAEAAPAPALTPPTLTLTPMPPDLRLSWTGVGSATAYRVSARQDGTLLGDSILPDTFMVGAPPGMAVEVCVQAVRGDETGPAGCTPFDPGTWPGASGATTTARAPGGAAADMAPAAAAVAPTGPVDPALGTFNNLPANLSTLTDARWGSGSLDAPPGWTVRSDYPGATVHIVRDPSAPWGGSLEHVYPSGMRDGLQPGLAWFGRGLAPAREVFLGVVMRYSAGWITHNNEVKLHLFATGGSWFGIFDGCWNNGVVQWSVGTRGISNFPVGNGDCWLNNVRASPRYADGAWVKQELYVRKNSPGQADGVVRLWIDGQLVAEHTTMRFPDAFRFEEFQHAGTWGGGGAPVPRTQSVFIARTVIAAR